MKLKLTHYIEASGKKVSTIAGEINVSSERVHNWLKRKSNIYIEFAANYKIKSVENVTEIYSRPSVQ